MCGFSNRSYGEKVVEFAIQCGVNFRGDIKLCKLNMHFNLLEVSFILQKFTVIYSVRFHC